MSHDKDPPARPASRRRTLLLLGGAAVAGALAATAAAALLVNVSNRKHEAQNPYFRVVELTDETVDPAVWGKNFPLQHDGYRRTVDQVRTRYLDFIEAENSMGFDAPGEAARILAVSIDLARQGQLALRGAAPAAPAAPASPTPPAPAAPAGDATAPPAGAKTPPAGAGAGTGGAGGTSGSAAGSATRL